MIAQKVVYFDDAIMTIFVGCALLLFFNYLMIHFKQINEDLLHKMAAGCVTRIKNICNY